MFAINRNTYSLSPKGHNSTRSIKVRNDVTVYQLSHTVLFLQPPRHTHDMSSTLKGKLWIQVRGNNVKVWSRSRKIRENCRAPGYLSRSLNFPATMTPSYIEKSAKTVNNQLIKPVGKVHAVELSMSEICLLWT